MSRKAKDLWNRVWRTFLQGALGVFALTYFGPLFDLVQSFVSLGPGDQLPRIDLTGWSSWGNGVRNNDNTASLFDYLDPQYQFVTNASWTRAGHRCRECCAVSNFAERHGSLGGVSCR